MQMLHRIVGCFYISNEHTQHIHSKSSDVNYNGSQCDTT